MPSMKAIVTSIHIPDIFKTIFENFYFRCCLEKYKVCQNLQWIVKNISANKYVC
jgi:hypothetical protein